MPTFKVQGQVYHLLGSLLPSQEEKFLQIYFISDYDQQAQQRINTNRNLKLSIINQLQEMLHEKNSYIVSFKFALETTGIENFKLIINADKRPNGEHERRFNAPVCNEIGLIMAGDEYGKFHIINCNFFLILNI